MWKIHFLEILALPNLPSRLTSAARALATSSPPSKAQWSAEERSVTWRDRALHAGILDIFSRLTWVTLQWNTVLMWTVQLPTARSSCYRDRSNRLISSFFKELHGFELGGVRKYHLLRDRWILIIEFLLLGKKDRSYRCCSLLLSLWKGSCMYSIFICLHSHLSEFESGLITFSTYGKKKGFYSARHLCVYFVPNYSHCHILVFSFSLLLFINVYIIYFYYQGFYFNSYYPVCKLTVDC